MKIRQAKKVMIKDQLEFTDYKDETVRKATNLMLRKNSACACLDLAANYMKRMSKKKIMIYDLVYFGTSLDF